MEVWALLVTLSHCQRARSEVFVVVPLWRAAVTRWPSVAISAAAAKLSFSLCTTERILQIPGLDFCQIGMTAIVMGDVNAVYKLDRRQMLAARALNERSFVGQRASLPAYKDDW